VPTPLPGTNLPIRHSAGATRGILTLTAAGGKANIQTISAEGHLKTTFTANNLERYHAREVLRSVDQGGTLPCMG